MVPSLPKDVSRAGRSVAEDVELFPSDEQLTQRTLWFAFLLALGWTILGLAGALPIYLISTPCLAHLPPRAKYTGALSTLQDLSLLRLLRFWDSEHESVTSISALQHRASFVENDARSNLRIRFILLTILVGLIAVGPALYKILKQFNRLVAYRQRWVTVRCQENEMGWLSARNAPGFANWGEQHFKDFILKTGLSSSFENSSARNGSRRRPDQRRLTYGGDEPKNTEGGNLEIDIQSLFSIG
jgi:calcium permeable stress-gated cation channel